jgi:hypothetical protein
MVAINTGNIKRGQRSADRRSANLGRSLISVIFICCSFGYITNNLIIRWQKPDNALGASEGGVRASRFPDVGNRAPHFPDEGNRGRTNFPKGEGDGDTTERKNPRTPETLEQRQPSEISALSGEKEEKKKVEEQQKDSEPVFHIIISTGDETISTVNMRCIESIFYFHPGARLYIHSPEDTGISGMGHPKLKPLADKGYGISVNRYQPQDWLEKAMDLEKSNIDRKAAERFLSNLSKLKKEKYWYTNETNLMRMCLLFVLGGIYLDTDVILISPVLASDDRIDNAMGRNKNKFHCAVMKFTQPGNRFLASTISNFLQNYNGKRFLRLGVVYGTLIIRLFFILQLSHCFSRCFRY